MHVAVCIVGFANAGDIEQCLRALAAQTHKDFEVIVCENGGNAAFAALKAALPSSMRGVPKITLLNAPENPGYAGGVNRAISASPHADAWWVLNPDTVPDPQALAALSERLAKGDVAAVAGPVLGHNGRLQSFGGGRWRAWLARVEALGAGAAPDRLPDPADVERQFDYLTGASMLVGRDFIAAAGLMTEDYFLYVEEVDWCIRARAKGVQLGFAPEARVLHAHGSTTGAGGHVSTRSRLSVYLDERNKVRLVRETTPRRLPVAVLSSLGLMTMRFAFQGAFKQWGYAIAGWAAALRDERGKPAWMLEE
jgi:GT2 family glycosyltransferase